jgi:negative regulator of sigma E activity
MWNPSTAEVWVDAARADGITVYSMCASGYIASLALADGMRVFYGTPLNGTSSGSPADMTRFPAAGPRIQALASLAGPLRYDSALMSENYTFTACQGASVAGRDTIELRIDPKWPGNVRRTVWVDFYAGTALRVEDRNYRGDLIWLWEVERIAFGPPRRQIMQAARAALSSDEAVPYSEPSMSLGEISRAAGFRVTLPAWVPEGYRLVALRPAQGILDREEPGPGRLRLMARMTSVAQLIYSDGLGAITFYQRPVPWWARRASAPRVGHAIEWERNGIRYVLVGDVDPQLLLKMARSL